MFNFFLLFGMGVCLVGFAITIFAMIYSCIVWRPYSPNRDEDSPEYKFKWHKWRSWYPVYAKRNNGGYRKVFREIVLRKAKWNYDDSISYEYLDYKDFGDPKEWAISMKGE